MKTGAVCDTLAMLDPATGETTWRVRIPYDVALDDPQLAVSTRTVSIVDDYPDILRYRRDTGARLLPIATGGPGATDRQIIGNLAVLATDTDQRRTMAAYDLDTGKRSWRRTERSLGSWTLIGADPVLVHRPVAGELVRYDDRGRSTRLLRTDIREPQVPARGLALVVANEQLTLVDTVRGGTVWRRHFELTATAWPSEERLVEGTVAGDAATLTLVAFDNRTPAQPLDPRPLSEQVLRATRDHVITRTDGALRAWELPAG